MDAVLTASDFLKNVPDIAVAVVRRTNRQFNHLIPSRGCAQDLQMEVGKLEYQADWIRMLVDDTMNDGRLVDTSVQDWLKRAKEDLDKATLLLDEFEKASKTDFYGTLFYPIRHYRYSRRAMGMIEDSQELTREGNNVGQFYDVSCSTTRANDDLPSIRLRGGDAVFPSRASMIERIKDALASDSVRVVGIYGMAGVGKSNLLQDVKRMIMAERWFDCVAMADVSLIPDIKMIQGDIAYALGLRDMKNREIIRMRADVLRRRLEEEERQNKNVLIILDDLWEGLDLKSVGIPSGIDNKAMGCKLLLTSRYRDILLKEMGCDPDQCFRLDGLREDEAKTLFERMVGDKVHDDAFKPLVEAAIEKCAGLPFLIVAMAESLKNADLYEWKYILRQIAKSRDREISEMINRTLQLSYDRIGDEEKSLLQLCVTNEDSEPSFENLVKDSVASGLLPKDSQEARDKLRSLIRKLQAASLLMDSEEADGFKIHDLVRNFVASIASKDSRSSRVG